MPSKYLVAVSGGVDSVVLLDMLASPNSKFQIPNSKIIVAHFDHGIRQESAEDAEFVRGLAEHYGIAFEMKREELGPDASEELARDRRYAFLHEVAKKHKATIVTAHHADDLVETIAINLKRGTGWRGIAVLDNPAVHRPLLGYTKKKLLDYAQAHSLKWREDVTNQDTKYLRNELRQKLSVLKPEDRKLLQLLRNRQVVLRKMIDNETDRLVGASPHPRHLFITVPSDTAMEILRAVFAKEGVVVPTRPQLERTLHAIKVLHAGKKIEVATGISLRFTKTHFVVEHVAKVV